jgi:hypothetical protein
MLPFYLEHFMLLTNQRWCFSPTELLNLARLNATDRLIAIYEQDDLTTSAMPRTYEVLIQRNGIVTDFFNNGASSA